LYYIVYQKTTKSTQQEINERNQKSMGSDELILFRYQI